MNLLPKTISLFATSGLLVCSANAATTFVTQTGSNGDGLDGAGALTTTTLTLSAGDGGGNIDLETSTVYNGVNPQTLDVSATGLGVGNDKWGNGPQGWSFSFDQDVYFDGLGFNTAGGAGEGLSIQSSAWIGASIYDTGQNWSFNSVTGTYSIVAGNGPTFDFSTAAAPLVLIGQAITIEHNSGNGGSSMT